MNLHIFYYNFEARHESIHHTQYSHPNGLWQNRRGAPSKQPHPRPGPGVAGPQLLQLREGVELQLREGVVASTFGRYRRYTPRERNASTAAETVAIPHIPAIASCVGAKHFGPMHLPEPPAVLCV